MKPITACGTSEPLSDSQQASNEQQECSVASLTNGNSFESSHHPVSFELDLSGNFQFVSENSSDLLNVPQDEVVGHSVKDFLGKTGLDAFTKAAKCLLEDDSHSYHVRLKHPSRISLTQHPHAPNHTSPLTYDDSDLPVEQFDAVGILIRNSHTNTPVHTMWVAHPVTNNTIDSKLYANKVLEVIGLSAGLLDQYLSSLRESFFKTGDLQSLPLPRPEFCQICERNIQSWFFEVHSKLCLITSTFESIVQSAQDSLLYFRSTLLQIQNELFENPSLIPLYKDEPLILYPDYDMSSLSIPKDARNEFSVSFLSAFLDQITYYLNLVIDISIPPVKVIVNFSDVESLRLQSPKSEVSTDELQNFTPSLQNCSQAVINLWKDLRNAFDMKVIGITRLKNAVYYSERIRLEVDYHVQEVIDNVVSELSSLQDSNYVEGLTLDAPTIAAPGVDVNAVKEINPQFKHDTEFTPYSDSNSDLSRSSSCSLLTQCHPYCFTHDSDCCSAPVNEVPDIHSPFQRLKVSEPCCSDHKFEESRFLSPNSSPRFLASDASGHSLSLNARTSLNSRGRSNNLSEKDLRLPSPSPRIHTILPSATHHNPSINDYKILKPISKGAFGSVYLAQKRTTGDYFAVKILKKSDMIAKNQVVNVRAERAILMAQGEIPFVAKLYYTFQSRDYLYLVMEYLNGGDCGSLLKTMGVLELDWIHKYLAEIVLCLGALHNREIVHRDIKPENLLIAQSGHLKLTDFGLSRVGYLNRQNRIDSESSFAPNLAECTGSLSDLSLSTASSLLDTHSVGASESPKRPTLNERLLSLDGTSIRLASQSFSLENGSEDLLLAGRKSNAVNSNDDNRNQATDSPKIQPFLENDDSFKRFIGTPDYIAPEVILGNPGIKASDWWSVGCVLFEFLFGYPPFNADSPTEIFKNIIARRIAWPSNTNFHELGDAVDLINRLLCMEPSERLGAGGVEEVKSHPFFRGVNWDNVVNEEPPFVPKPFAPDDTIYFDSRGLDELDYSRYYTQPSEQTRHKEPLSETIASSIPQHLKLSERKNRMRSNTVDSAPEFGSFSYRNLEILDKANRSTIQKLKKEHQNNTPTEASIEDMHEYMTNFKNRYTSNSYLSEHTSRRASVAGMETPVGTRSRDEFSLDTSSTESANDLNHTRMVAYFNGLQFDDEEDP
ncbi:AGC protein kinase Cek1 [Schizosaccharomyces cryophilus OY26]|uniref:non-specific serine/threonine protein kinase n=1 Tax=Schizosaccharomyces cryophilus (strain OY26 / ATCC MYA-4695 / CBS 11777 / NBRC 106824 / NRRL Y48691) TaxID=653667 RepID=S9XE12_SCHCR|nr:AGC protein kinase Cek1 [Schizosaccharomyces cryophilus OY26]EPY52016.1 AGC protein kinase Cek1 [Schizosaccharomyces cryophilus OY26]